MTVKILLIIFSINLLITAGSCGLTNNNVSNVKSIAEQEGEYLWVSENYRLVRWHIETKELEVFENISGELLIDSENTLWIFGTDTVSHFDGQAWQHFRVGSELADGGVFSFVETDGYIWVGTVGLSRYDQRNQSWEVILQTPSSPPPTPIPQDRSIVESFAHGIHAIIPASQESMWLGTSRGLTYLENDSQQVWSNNVLNTDSVRCLSETTNTEVWVCTDGGVGLWNGSEWVEFIDGLIDPFLIVRGEGEDVWVVTRETGVVRWDGTDWHKWTNAEGLAGERPTSLVVDGIDGNVWVSTEKGISRWNGIKWQTYDTSKGLVSSRVNTLFQDTTGRLWAGTRQGLNYYSPQTDRWVPFP